MTLFSRLPLRLPLRCYAVKPQCFSLAFSQQRVAVNVPRVLLKTRASLRHASNVAPRAPASTKTAYPARLLIFHSPIFETVTIGICRIACVGIFAMGCLVVAPNVYQFGEPNHIWWSVPTVIVASALPLPFIHFMTRPFVTNIFIETPAFARRSKESLITFVRRLPPDTPMEIETMGLLPWPRTKALRVSELRSVPEGFGRPVNLEQVTQVDTRSRIPKAMRWSLTQFYARPYPSHWAKSRAPEVWPLVLDFIIRNSSGSVAKQTVSSTINAHAAWTTANVQKRTPATAARVLKNQQNLRRKPQQQ